MQQQSLLWTRATVLAVIKDTMAQWEGPECVLPKSGLPHEAATWILTADKFAKASSKHQGRSSDPIQVVGRLDARQKILGQVWKTIRMRIRTTRQWIISLALDKTSPRAGATGWCKMHINTVWIGYHIMQKLYISVPRKVQAYHRTRRKFRHAVVDTTGVSQANSTQGCSESARAGKDLNCMNRLDGFVSLPRRHGSTWDTRRSSNAIWGRKKRLR